MHSFLSYDIVILRPAGQLSQREELPKMKKYATILFSTALLFSLAACSGENAGNEVQDSDLTSPTTVVAETAAPTEEKAQASFEETILVDNDICTFKITAIQEDSIWGYTLKAYLENKTDLELMFSLGNVSVNGFMCDPLWASSVSAGMKANEEISFSSDSFKVNGIDAVTDITFTLSVYDNNDWTSDHLVTETFTIYPLGEEAVQLYSRTAAEGETVLFDNENYTMIVTGYDPDNIWGYTVNVFLENKTDDNLMFSISDASVNGFMCDPFWAHTVAAGKRSNTTISWMASDFEANSITEVESLTLPIRVYDADDWSSASLVEDTFTLNP